MSNGPSAGGAADAAALRQRVAALMPDMQTALERLVRIPSIAFEGFPDEPVRQAAEAVAGLLEDAGLDNVRLLDIPDGPQAVYGERPAPPGAPTVLLYGHYDVQPPGDESLWTTPPFEPAVRKGRLYGRGAADDKGGVLMHVAALKALGADLPVGAKALIEGQEEAGLGSLESWVAQHPEMVAADVIVMGDVGNWKIGKPTLTVSLRGMAAVTVEVETLAGAVHSGMFGGPAPDALVALIRMLATMHDVRGNVAVAGLNRIAWEGVDYPQESFRADAGVLNSVNLVGEGSVAERLWARPAINVIGIDAPAVEGAPNAVIPKCRATVSTRVAPGQDPGAARQAVRRHLAAAAPWHVKLSFEDGPAGEGFLAKTGGPAYAVAEQSWQTAFGSPTVHFGEGGSIPLVAAFIAAVPKAEILLWGPEEPECKIHGADESVDLTELQKCALAEALFLTEMASAKG